MNIIGLGTDIVEIARIEKAVKDFQEHFRSRICTAEELQLAGSRRGSLTFLAGRWAAKEAAAKALGCGVGKHCAFTDINILNDALGRPELRFSGAAAILAGSLGVTEIKVSISHEAHYAVATVILCGK